jgi:hypothetical protein
MERRTGEVLTTVIPIIALTIVAAAFLLFLMLQVRGRYTRPHNPSLVETLPPVDLEAFRNLTDPQEEIFLRHHLSPREFRRVQRLRLRAANLYVSALAQNAGSLIQAGQKARLHPDPAISASGQEVTQQALRLKLLCLAAQWKLNVATLCPTLLSPSSKLADRYSQVANLADALPTELAA